MNPKRLAMLLMGMHGSAMPMMQPHQGMGPGMDGTIGDLKPPYDKVYSDYVMGRMTTVPKNVPGNMMSVQKSDTQY